MTSLIIKLFSVPIGIIIASWIFPNVEYTRLYQPIIVGLISAGVGLIMEFIILRRKTLWLSTFSDLIVSWVIVFGISLMFNTAYVSIWGAFWTAVLLTVMEYFLHRFLIEKGLTKKHA
ncbi:DUF2512 family protein [Paenibacillus camelliae]|uniref:DUF2512 family protein n=1 Tax=Paenibacillus camelliae TaxID=512410 RepID=UPI00203F8CCF|nr:DUF2512 family protein [Paenibacillus camelliae]MCM3634328.1 YndM family protein [Paenibacillus camelliae]